MIRYFFLIVLFISLNILAQSSEIQNPINTGVNMTVAILAVDSCIIVGDTIVALYKIDDLNYKESNPDAHPKHFSIAGLTVWRGERLAITIWGNDSTSDKKDGFLHNEIINWAIIKNNKYVSANMIYRVGNNYWKYNGISVVDSIKTGC